MKILYYLNILIKYTYSKKNQTFSNNINKKHFQNKDSKNKYIKKKSFIFLLIISLFSFIYIYSYNIKNYFIDLKNFVNDCRNLKKYNKGILVDNKNLYLSICIPTYNMEKYIEKALLSIINQTFQYFEIIIVNDNSNDNSISIINRIQIKDKRIRIINHIKNLGVYFSRIEAALNANGKYILFMDPDDMILNQYLYEELYNYNLKNNLDIIEFLVFHQEEGKKKFFFPNNHEYNHYHNFRKKIIYQPELSDILFYVPNTKQYNSIFCRTIWNKIVRKPILIKTIKYIEKSFHNLFLITADDTPINMINFHFAFNYSNIKLPGYLYNIRKNSMSRLSNDHSHNLIISYNFLLYFKLFYKFIKEFKKDLNFLFYDLKSYFHLLKFKSLNATEYILKTIEFLKDINKDDISQNFKDFIKFQILNLMK